MRYPLIIALLLAPATAQAAVWGAITPIGSGVLADIGKVAEGSSKARAVTNLGPSVSNPDGWRLYFTARSQGQVSRVVYDINAARIRLATPEEVQAWKAQREDAEDPDGSKRAMKAYIENALKDPVSIETFEDIEQKLEQYRRILRYLLER